ncbi:hypothetical protein I6A62_04215 [Frankia sp. AgW1.1]|nr:hypothetical protein [Frankia sp. AgW1.1]MBL7618652.1 hypothetical protein [Frankia sp. AgB1.8]
MATTVELVQAKYAPSNFREGLLFAVTYAVPYAVVGGFLISRRPDLPFGWLLAGTAVAVSVGSAVAGVATLAALRGDTSSLIGWGHAAGSLEWLPVCVQGLVNVRFPSGRLSTRGDRLLERALLAGCGIALFAGVFNGTTYSTVLPDGTTRQIRNSLTSGTTIGHLASDLTVVVPIVILLGLVAGLRVVRRAWKTSGVERDQLRWRAFGVVLALCLFPLAVTDTLPEVPSALDGVVFVATLAIPVVRYRLWAIDTIIRRSMVYAVAITVEVAAFAGIAVGIAAVASERFGLLVAAAVTAVAFAPALGRSRRLVDHVFYGDRNDPYRALSDVGRRLAAVAAPGEVLPGVVAAVADSLRLPYVAIERPSDGSALAVHGDPAMAEGAGAERWPAVYQGATVGMLVASPRRGEAVFDTRDRVVLADIARQAGAAVHAEALTADLRESRQRLVSAREEERRRLRRDLHDGLGPLLTSIGLNIDAARARRALATSGGASTETPDPLLARAKDASSQAIADLRGIVYGLRPPALDDLGLAGAVRTHVDRLVETGGPQVAVDLDGLPELPAAIEVAAFRITVEAVTNVVRHAQARCCTARVHVDDQGALIVDVADDGTARTSWPAGVGLLAMHERAGEVGGTLTAGPTAAGGRVRASLPLAAGQPAARALPAVEQPSAADRGTA